MAPDDRGMRNGGRNGGRQALKKGPWTTTEDAILMEYVKKNGEGNWNAVQRNSGLMRCGKSCRLRWANHLRPNLKKGSFSVDEERIIIELHAKLGNKWARMAAQLPGRTDNEIKNYWNTRLKRRQRAGLPIYPQDLQPAQNHQENNQHPQTLLSSSFNNQNTNYNNSPSLSLLDIFNPSTMKPAITHQFPLTNPSPLCLSSTNNNNIFRNPPKGLSLTLPMRNSQFSSLPPYNFPQARSSSNSLPVPSFQHNYQNFNFAPRPFTGIVSNQNGLISANNNNNNSYPSGQSISLPVTAASSSENTAASDFGTSDANNYANVTAGLSRGNSGLLEDLLEESQTRAAKTEENFLDLMEDADDFKGKSLWEDYGLVEEEAGEEAILTEESAYSFAHGVDIATLDKNPESPSPPNSSSGISKKEDSSLQGINQGDDDLMSLLDNFPLAVPVPDWYDDEDGDNKNNCNNGQSSNVTSTTGDHNAENQGGEDSSKSAVEMTTSSEPRDHDWGLGGCCWNNMPSFC